MIQHLIESLQPIEYPLDLQYFSSDKKLFDFQQRALRNAFRFLYYYYVEILENKEVLWKVYTESGFRKTWEGKSEILRRHLKDREINYKAFLNRASFWMATGSGKTLVIVKLIELLDYMMMNGIIPKRDILFLTQRDDLIRSFREHVDEYNKGRVRKIIIDELKNLHSRKANPHLYDKENILVFLYRSDLISDKKGYKLLHYENYQNNGKWYLILDEAHKGDNEESKRKQIFILFTRNGFLFNFSATFTDEFDKASTIFRFNLSDFIREGYGKHIAIMETQTAPFKKKETEFTFKEKKEIIIKLLILTGFLRKIRDKRYPSPLAVVLVNTVNTEDADLKLFFKELFHVAQEGISESDFIKLREELFSELKNIQFWNEVDKLDNGEIATLMSFTVEDFYSHFFSAPGPSGIEIIYHPDNKQEIAIQLKNSDRPFALIKIGDVINWLKELYDKVIIRRLLENEDFFMNIDERENISLLSGSRSFYEGWDSPRPSVITYINIGTKDAQKFILQSLGRGVRIKVSEGEGECRKRRNLKKVLETLYVFSTKRKEVLSIINETLKKESVREYKRSWEVRKSPDIHNKPKLDFTIGQDDLKEAKSIVDNAQSDIVLSLLTGKGLETIREFKTALSYSDGLIKVREGRIFKDPISVIQKFADFLSLNIHQGHMLND